MSEIKTIDDITLLLDFLKGTNKHEVGGYITRFSNMGKVYSWTNEEFQMYPIDNLNDKKVLTITSSGDHALDAILKGAKNIDSIDINVFCKYYSALKIAMIKKYDYRKFYEMLKSFTSDDIDLCRMKILDEVSIFLTEREIDFWSKYSEFKEKSYRNIFYYQPFDSRLNSYGCEEKYNSLKEKLDDVIINYYDGDIIYSTDILKNKSYDCIYLSNILERIESEWKDEDRIAVLMKLKKLLNNDALIYNYSLGKDEDCFDFISAYFILEYEFNSYSAEEKDIPRNHSMLIMRKK